MQNNCEIWAIVDFGIGPVKVRCTETGEHNQHKCVINITPEDDSNEMGYHNVFDNPPKV